MTVAIEDPLGLNRANVQDVPIAEKPSDISTLSEGAAQGLSLMGSRHSQGGHTVMND